MNIRNIILPAGLAFFLAGCVTNPRPLPPRDYDQRYDVNYYDYRSTPSYEGYYYARIIFINNVPYYVDDDRYIRPIPPRLQDHFRRYPYDTLGRPPVFSRDTEVRDGYPVSRIIYLNGVPYHVGNDRIAQPLPKQLHQHFRYTPANQGNAPANGNRPQPPAQHDNARNNEPPVHVRDQDREQMKQPPLERGQREGESKAPADSKGTTTPSAERRISPWLQDQQNTVEPPAGTTKPSPERRISPWLQDQQNTGESRAATPSGKERDLNSNRPQAIDTVKMNADKMSADKKNADKMSADKMSADKMSADKKNADKMSADKKNADKKKTDMEKANKEKADKKKSPPGKKDKPDDSGNKKDKQGDSTKADDDSGNKKDNKK